MKDLQIFSSPQFGQVRIVTDESNQPWFCLADLCSILELHSNVVRQRLEDDVCSTYPISDNLGRTQQANFVNEDGLYDVILDSRKPEARKFRKWITSEVLPSIRATGSYSVAGVEWGTPVLQMLRTMETQVSQLLTTQKEVCQLRNDLDELKERTASVPKASTIVAYVTRNNIPLDIQKYPSTGRKATNLAKKKGVKISRLNDPRFGHVNVYPDTLLDELFADHYRPKAEEGLPILDLSKLNEQKGGNK
jgi:prophage antirepressor-like protein